MYSVDPATFDAYKKNDKKTTEEKKNSKQVNTLSGAGNWTLGCVWMCVGPSGAAVSGARFDSAANTWILLLASCE